MIDYKRERELYIYKLKKFSDACKYIDLKKAKYLWEKNKYKIEDINPIFIQACIEYNMEIVNFLSEKIPHLTYIKICNRVIPIPIYNRYVIFSHFYEYDIDIFNIIIGFILWLFQIILLLPKIIFNNNSEILCEFKMYCLRGNLDKAKNIYDQNKNKYENVNVISGYSIFIECCKRNLIGIVELICDIELINGRDTYYTKQIGKITKYDSDYYHYEIYEGIISNYYLKK